MEITHRADDDGRMVQTVTPERLAAILSEAGDSLSRPDDFGPDDEWNVCGRAACPQDLPQAEARPLIGDY